MVFGLPLPTLKSNYWDLRRKAEDLVAKELGMAVFCVAFIDYWDNTCVKQGAYENISKERIADRVKSKMIELCETEKQFAPYREQF